MKTNIELPQFLGSKKKLKKKIKKSITSQGDDIKEIERKIA